jgi:putative DNA-invertase from lambdoid prophage Rac
MHPGNVCSQATTQRRLAPHHTKVFAPRLFDRVELNGSFRQQGLQPAAESDHWSASLPSTRSAASLRNAVNNRPFYYRRESPVLGGKKMLVNQLFSWHPDYHNYLPGSPMSRTFMYARVSTAEQTTENQLLEARSAGFAVLPRHTIVETISGSVPAAERSGFSKLLDRLDEGDKLVVSKLDRLGRNTTDVLATVERLAALGVHVHCLALKGVDLTSASGRLHMTVLAAVAQFERDLLIERTHAGLARAKAEGKKLGRRNALSDKQKAEIRMKRAQGASARELANEYRVSHPTILKVTP